MAEVPRAQARPIDYRHKPLIIGFIRAFANAGWPDWRIGPLLALTEAQVFRLRRGAGIPHGDPRHPFRGRQRFTPSPEPSQED